MRPLLWIALAWVGAAALAALVLSAIWLLAVRFHYRLRQPPPTRLRARCDDGWELAVHHRPAPARRFAQPVLLCHGLLANRFTFELDPPHSLAHHLASLGFDCFTVEWRGTGDSRRPPRGKWPWDYSIDDHIRLDAPALLRLALADSGARDAFWIGHSLGGLIGYAAAQAPDVGSHLRGLVAMGAPVFFGYGPTLKRATRLFSALAWPFRLRQRWVTQALAPWMGRVQLPWTGMIINPSGVSPALQRKLFAHLFASASRKLVRQLSDWVRHDAFRSLDGAVDYRAGLTALSLPALVVGGSHDALAPPAVVRAQFERLGSTDKTLRIFGTPSGDRLDYGHGDLLFGGSAPDELYAVVGQWLAARATAWPE